MTRGKYRFWTLQVELPSPWHAESLCLLGTHKKFLECYTEIQNLREEYFSQIDIITDNINFHGFVKDKDKIESRDLKGLVNKIENYIAFLKSNKKYETEFLDIGDGLSVSCKLWVNILRGLKIETIINIRYYVYMFIQ